MYSPPETPPPVNGPMEVRNDSTLTSCSVDTIGDRRRLCSCCEDHTQIVTAYCSKCKENLCGPCVAAHQRVTSTKLHLLTFFEPYGCEGDEVLPTAASHPPPFFSLDLCKTNGILKVYQGRLDKAREDRSSHLANARKYEAILSEAKAAVAEMVQRVTQRYADLSTLMHVRSDQVHKLVMKQDALLKKNLSIIRDIKMQTLNKQIIDLDEGSASLKLVIQKLAACSKIDANQELNLINACDQAESCFKLIGQLIQTLQPLEDDSIMLEAIEPPESVIKCLYSVHGSAYGPYSYAKGDGLIRAILGKEANFTVFVKDHLNELRPCGGDIINVSIASPDERMIASSQLDCHNGEYRVRWKALQEGDHVVHVTIKNQHVSGSPFVVKAQTGRDYGHISQPSLVFGTEGKESGMLSRPWGVCCSRNGGLILIANRSNNRIEVFTIAGRFCYNFGSAGSGQGQFNLPASVCCDSNDRVIVSDKDNHRIQVFTLQGAFILAFGKHGSLAGEFNYPWDVACNSKDQICVTDSKNHRIQLFDSEGKFLTMYGLEMKPFDLPRGVTFTSRDEIVVTDFNKHLLLVIQPNFNRAEFLGGQLDAKSSLFHRPNGVAVDNEGNFIVADSRHNQVQIFSSEGKFITAFGGKGTQVGCFERPCGVCVSPDDKIIVVDFGNSRIQVF